MKMLKFIKEWLESDDPDMGYIRIEVTVNLDDALRYADILKKWKEGGYSEANVFELLLDCFEKHSEEDYPLNNISNKER